MISTVQSSNAAYVQQGSLKEDATKSVSKTDKSDEADKLSTLKEQIENGSYKVDLTKTAQAVAGELL